IEAVEDGIDQAFSRREDRQAVGRVNSLSYCRDAVLEAWERRADAARGRGRPADAASGTEGVAGALESLSARLQDCRVRRPDLAPPLESARASLSRLAVSGRSGEEVEASLARLDRRLAHDLYDALPEGDRAALDRDVERQLGGALARMDP